MRADLQRRIDALSQAIRAYPTPIARCDEQLTALIEERSSLLDLVSRTQEPDAGCMPDAVWVNDGGCNAA